MDKFRLRLAVMLAAGAVALILNAAVIAATNGGSLLFKMSMCL